MTGPQTLDSLRFEAKRMQRAWIAREAWAVERLRQYLPGRADFVRADFLHVVAREHGFASWPALKADVGRLGFERAEAVQRLKVALAHGQVSVVAALLEDDAGLPDGLFGLECALYRRGAVEAALARDAGLAVKQLGPRTAFQHLAFSKWITARPDLEAEMLGVAEALRRAGADMDAPLSGMTPMQGAVAAGNVALLRWLLAAGVSPDGAGLGQAVAAGQVDAVRVLLEAGVPVGGDVVAWALETGDAAMLAAVLAFAPRAAVNGGALFHAAQLGCDARMVALLLEAGADPGATWQGVGIYGYARALGGRAVAEAVPVEPMTAVEMALAQAAEGVAGARLDMGAVPPVYRTVLRDVLVLPGRLAQVKALVALGFPYDAPDAWV